MYYDAAVFESDATFSFHTFENKHFTVATLENRECFYNNKKPCQYLARTFISTQLILLSLSSGLVAMNDKSAYLTSVLCYTCADTSTQTAFGIKR